MNGKGKKLVAGACALALAAVLCACDAASGDHYFFPQFTQNGEGNPNYQYDSIVEQGVRSVEEEPKSYFSLDCNTAGYSLVRAQLNAGHEIAADSVRLEELVNYFDYDFPAPQDGEMSVQTSLCDCPWSDNRLLTVGIRTQEKKLSAVRNNYVFLIDRSGSMSAGVEGLEGVTCMDLVKLTVFKILEGLGERDSVSIVTYASGAEELLEPVLADEHGKERIVRAVNALGAYGSTYGSGGIERAYRNAEKYFSDEGNNRVILMTDGDFNVGISSETELKEFIREKAKGGVYLSVLGYGMGNMRDDFMQTLALNGNGNYAYIDTPMEAERISEKLDGLLTVLAKDAKAGVEFTQNVTRYRILGYDMKMMSESEFNDPEKDAGEIGSNLCVTAVYEVELKEGFEGGKLADVRVRYRTIENEEKEVMGEVTGETAAGEDTAFIACVAEFALVLRNSAYKGSASLNAVSERLLALSAYLERDPYKTEFFTLVKKAIDLGYWR